MNCTHVSDFLPLFLDKEDEPWMDRLVEVMANPSTKVGLYPKAICPSHKIK